MANKMMPLQGSVAFYSETGATEKTPSPDEMKRRRSAPSCSLARNTIVEA